MLEKNLYIIAGCNGAGKTAASFAILPEILDCSEFVNADEIAKELSPFQPEKAALEAGRIMLSRVNELLDGNDSFAFETTLSTRSYKVKIEEAKKKGFIVTLIFYWLNDVKLAKERVQMRVSEGGHNIEPDVIERRYVKGIKNLFDIYLPIVNLAFIIDNSFENEELIAKRSRDYSLNIFQEEKFNQLRNFYERN
ncbi:zeta toxin family protein [Dyadobacter sp. CY327]|uniref:zeta toxin family protein n=1 Tax=Dyadobacter sp. CY327 TaxID=2907301 RepID=UPI001EFFCC63|nr:zeta toxin family protein [Dyadobacter sp. CY327]MCE7069380.1 zeta toxin family protein [Dyadobacter sp. CY327]